MNDFTGKIPLTLGIIHKINNDKVTSPKFSLIWICEQWPGFGKKKETFT